MKCQRCGHHEAAVKFIEVEDGVKRSRWLCEGCAAEEGAHPPLPAEDGPINLQAFLGEAPDSLEKEEAVNEAPCPVCGCELDAVRESALLGCPGCYLHFSAHVQPLIQRYHRASTHLGKAPRAREPQAARRLEISQMRTGLEAAVAAEDFEEAARLRDQINQLQREPDPSGELGTEGPTDV